MNEHNGNEDEAIVRKPSRIRKEAEAYISKLENRGVIFLSRVPPFMKPNKARDLFEQYGEVTRLYLAEEDVGVRHRRKKAGGNASKQFSEGWIEYADKKIAKSVAESLNNTKIAGRKGDFYHDDNWNIKYLKGFKWDYLTEKFAYERRVREQKLNASMMSAKRANAEFAELVEKNKIYEHIQERKRKRNPDAGATSSHDELSNSKKRKFMQVKSIGENHRGIDGINNKALLKTLTKNTEE